MSNVLNARVEMKPVDKYRMALEAALALPENTIPKELPRAQRDAMREKIRRESARRVDVEQRVALFEEYLPADDAAKLADVYHRLSTKPSVIKAACEAYTSAHGPDLTKIDHAIDAAMRENVGKKSE